jgi:DNA-binding response OmpR family regulator
MQKTSILWADDEIDLLKPHILFLEQKGYSVSAVPSGSDAIEKIQEEKFDVVFLDESMPGMSGLETLEVIKGEQPNVPVIMITKNEEEDLMDQAIGGKIADYLLKPINSRQILLSLKKILDSNRLVSETTNQKYQRNFQQLSMELNDASSFEDWESIYAKIAYWEIEISQTEAKSMMEVLEMQKSEANVAFFKFIKKNYVDWINGDNAPILSKDVFSEYVFPTVRKGKPTFFILIDNLRFDQWKVLEPLISPYFSIDEVKSYYSILPTTTAYARNAIFSGLMPSEIAKKLPQYWVDDTDDEGKNQFEEQLLTENLKRNGLSNTRMTYNKVIRAEQGKDVHNELGNMLNNGLNAIVYNFVDMLSHARTDSQMMRELAGDESAYRELTKSWFIHSPLFETLKWLAEKDVNVIITTDHGTIRTNRPYKIVGDRNTNTNLRYKHGKNLSYDKKNVLEAYNPEEFMLPKQNVSTTYAFATEDYFFAYPNNYNHYVRYYKNTFQHGGISMEEMICPIAFLSQKK